MHCQKKDRWYIHQTFKHFFKVFRGSSTIMDPLCMLSSTSVLLMLKLSLSTKNASASPWTGLTRCFLFCCAQSKARSTIFLRLFFTGWIRCIRGKNTIHKHAQPFSYNVLAVAWPKPDIYNGHGSLSTCVCVQVHFLWTNHQPLIWKHFQYVSSW